MLNAQLKSDVLALRGRWLLPNNLPIESLISLTRELAQFSDGSLETDEIRELTDFLGHYVQKILGMQGPARIEFFKKNQATLLPALSCEVHEMVRDELISRLIGYDVNRKSAKAMFSVYFE